VIEAGAEVGPRCRIGPCAVIGSGVVIGPDCRIGAHASLSHALLGARVYAYPGALIGQEGFGFAATKAGFLTVPQLGRTILEDDVEVGANTTIDRGSMRDTAPASLIAEQVNHLVHLVEGRIAAFISCTVKGHHLLHASHTGVSWRAHVD
jgi:UDP-3-O-[3-hydroxymyristoyl] glucosamine N-acyltransferase